MSILFTNEITKAVIKELRNAEQSVQIISAYCKEESIKRLARNIRDDIFDKKIMIRFRLDDLIRGSTDFDVAEYCLSSGWEVYFRFDLHAKTYIVDNKRGIVTSANATGRGLAIEQQGNMEMGTLVDIESPDIKKIDELYRDAIKLDKVLLEEFRKQYEKIDKQEKNIRYTWDINICSRFNPHINSLFSYELPLKEVYEEGDYIEFLDMDFLNVYDFKETFRWSNAYLWLMTVLKENDGCMFFGALSSNLHEVLITDPKPYRKDVKILLSNLLSLIETLNMAEIVVDRPNYSQRVRLVK